MEPFLELDLLIAKRCSCCPLRPCPSFNPLSDSLPLVCSNCLSAALALKHIREKYVLTLSKFTSPVSLDSK